MGYELYEGDCADVLVGLEANSVDAVVTDPPYGLSREPDIEEVLKRWLSGQDYERGGPGFMNQQWDSFVPGPHIWREVLRVTKPGGHLLCFAGTRTVDLMGISLRLAGWQVRDCIAWLYGAGFPKSLDVSAAIDEALGAERERVRIPAEQCRNPKSIAGGHGVVGGDRPWMRRAAEVGYHEKRGTNPATAVAAQWQGWGTGLKPAMEPIIVCRRPLSEPTVAQNILKWGTGGLNIAGCRLPTKEDLGQLNGDRATWGTYGNGPSGQYEKPIAGQGRWPPNVAFDEDAAALLDQQSGRLQSGRPCGRRNVSGYSGGLGDAKTALTGFGDSGGASRFFYQGKATNAERWFFCRDCSDAFPRPEREAHWHGHVDAKGRKTWEHLVEHPTIKPVELMRWLVRLVTPPGGTVLDPFAGTGTTVEAAGLEGMAGIGIERDREYYQIARRRVAAGLAQLRIAGF